MIENGGPSEIRTRDLSVRSAAHYPSYAMGPFIEITPFFQFKPIIDFPINIDVLKMQNSIFS